MRTPKNPKLLAGYERYETAFKMYKAAKKVFRLARKELKSSRIAVLRAKKKEANKNLRKKSEVDGSGA
jgi:hypothetical protein